MLRRESARCLTYSTPRSTIISTLSAASTLLSIDARRAELGPAAYFSLDGCAILISGFGVSMGIGATQGRVDMIYRYLHTADAAYNFNRGSI